MSTQTLTKDEISELTRAFGSTVTRAPKRAHQVSAYDFRRPDKLSKSKLRSGERAMSNLARAWAETISSVLRADVTAQVGSVEVASISAYAESLPEHAVVAVLRTDQDARCACIDVPARLALSVANRMAGGRGEIHQRRTKLTHIESVILNLLFSRLAESLGAIFEPVKPLRFRVSDVRQSVTDLHVLEDTVVVAGVDLHINRIEHRLNAVLPADLMELLADAMAKKEPAQKHADTHEVNPSVIESLLGSVPVPVSADLGHARVTMQELMNMQVGDVIMLDRPVSDPIAIKMGKHTAFYSHIGLAGDKLAVQINRGSA